MQELARIRETDPPIGSCPTAEDLAAYIDGALDWKEAAEITRHLADCEDCYAVYSGAVRFQLDSEPEAFRGGCQSPPSWPSESEPEARISSFSVLFPHYSPRK
jgi:hypothetical protein